MRQATRARAAGAAAAPELRWCESGGELVEAAALGGRYVLLGNGMSEWSAQWRPTPPKAPRGSRVKVKAKVEHLAFRTSKVAARTACERHYFEQHVNRMLAENDSEELTKPELAGAPITWKGPRYRP